MKQLLHAILFLFLTHISFSQPICGFDDLQKQLLKDPLEVKRQEVSELQIQQYINQGVLPQPQGIGTALYTIPVVVHVIHTGGAVGSIYNPSDDQILSVISYLNQCYDGTANNFAGGAGDIQIQFVMAKRDPNCNATNGIDRVNGNSLTEYTDFGVVRYTDAGVSDLELKNQSRWDPSNYYNIWLVNKIDNKDGTSGQYVAGYSAFAGSSPLVDGIVMLSTEMFVGSKVLPHEIGHALNLYHPFQGSSVKTSCPTNNNCSVDGDKICDTDPISYNADVDGVVDFTCRTGVNKCTNTTYSTKTENNVMNYTNCFTLFTPNQKTRMLAAMSLPSRVSLVNSPALQETYAGAQPCAPKINFELSASTVTETTTSAVDCRGYKDYTYNLTIGSSPAATATATLSATGTAIANVDYIVTTNGNFVTPSGTITFPAGARNNQPFTVRVFDDAAIEPSQTLILNYTVSSGGGNAVKGEGNTVLTITIKDNDVVPQPYISRGARIGTPTYTLGTSTDGSIPFDSKLISKKTTVLYKASELTAMGFTAGSITSFGFYLNKNSSRAFKTMEIRMGQTTLEYLIDNGGANGVAVNLVKSLASYNTVNGLNLFALDAPFTWNGTSSIAVQVCYNNVTAAAAESSDVGIGYSDGGSEMQGNTYFANISCATNYSNINYYQAGVKPVGYFIVGSNGPQIETLQNASATAYLGPFQEVYFYNSTGNILARIKNLSAFDYGCTQVTIDRAGSTSKGYINNIASNAVADKTISVVPANNNPNGAYDITFFYKSAEVTGWKQATGQFWQNAKILKTPAAVSTYTPGQVPQGLVQAGAGVAGFYGTDSTITASFTTGFAGFAVGNPQIAAAQIYTFTGNGLWTTAANWSNSTVPPAILPAGSQIIINPMPNGQCVLNTPQTIQAGATLSVNASKNFVVQGNLNIVQ